MVMNRTGSSPFSVLLDDVSERDDEYLGLNGRIYLDPLPANVTFSLPSTNNSQLISVPEFSEADGVLSLSFFLSGMIDFGSSVNDFAVESMVNLGDASNVQSEMNLGLELLTGEEFDLTLDVQKGLKDMKQPRWVHGLTGEILEATELKFNYTKLQNFTQSSREKVDNYLEDLHLNDSEADELVFIFGSLLGLDNPEMLVEVLRDGYISLGEMTIIDADTLSDEGLELVQRRAWHTRIWMPQLPSGEIKLKYNVELLSLIHI